ncbi:MAG: ribose 5-phosphate isomerase B [Rhodospirillaceae bacterium]|jgi:ribose 5-phosphate isomerase B|nr:ribose 5-phosphate isomerase B [Rhodospirillaceae bacterium]MBT4219104.1 ribose 5-phosphate isomerase B [Rhodospirillaceae bacterium]MBT4463611.1 ribose 5-phosphate isomerase B [Rhodospirillaceae bacterium]MBT5308236.1 ribose 5-phosphate isomerase B [Rhodospirillaceae bacterium]MBT6407769.1 ribose 5-phosphate isomerase B [Rhodospirillaceae bacterium]
MSSETIAVACDHGGYDLKLALIETIKELGFEILDLGSGTESVDYPDFGYALGHAIRDGQATRGVLVCGSGIGISIAANRIAEVRCALIHDALGAKLSRQHNNANVIAFGGRMTGIDLARDCLKVFLETEFEGGRHERRVEKLSNP